VSDPEVTPAAVVAWPPPVPPNNRANGTPRADNHPADHNQIANALDTMVARLSQLGLIRYGRVSVTFASGNGTITLAGAAGSATAPFPTSVDGAVATFDATAIGAGNVNIINAAGPPTTPSQQIALRCSSTALSVPVAVCFLAWGH
jgi:hypothetical protein